MATYMAYENLDTYFHEVDRKMLLNKYNYLTVDPDELTKTLYNTFEDEVSIIPRCECGAMSATYLLGTVCDKCNTEVKNDFESFDPILWIKNFDPNLKFLNPYYWGQLKTIIKHNGAVDNLRWLTDTSYNPQGVMPVMANLAMIIGGRGYGNFINNLDKVLIALSNHSNYKYGDKKRKILSLLDMYNNNKEELFSVHIPIINKRLFVMELTSKGNFTSTMLSDVIDIALYSIKLARPNTSIKRVNNGTGAIISKISVLFETYMKKKIAKKPGLARKHIYGTRSPFTFRTVITALPSKMDYDAIHVPWVIGVSVYRPHVMNKLLKNTKMSYRDISMKIFNAAKKYDSDIDYILKDLIKESNFNGLPCIAHRNPTQKQTSMLFTRITEFKTDLEDMSTSINKLIAKGPNFDYDGKTNNVHKHFLKSVYMRVNKIAILCSNV